MKYIVFIICGLLLIGCSIVDKNSKDESNTVTENKNNVTEKEKIEQTTSSQVTPSTVSTKDSRGSAVFDKMQNQPIKVTGIVEVMSNDRVDIISNWKSRSRVSHVVTGDKVQEIKALNGKIITVEGTIIKVVSPWNKQIIVNSYKIEAEKK